MTNPVLEVMARHRSIREFADEPLPDADLERAVGAARMASTSSHVQACSLLRVTDPAVRAELAELCGGQPSVERAGAFLVVCGDQRRHRLVAEERGAPFERNLETFLLAVIDAALLAQNLALALESMGYGICFIGGLRNRLPEVDALLGLPDDVLPFFGMCAGRPAQDPPPRPRLPLDGILFRDRYPDDATLRDAIRRHDSEMAAYYEARGKPGHDWSGGIARKFARRHREHLLDFYAKKGVRWR